MDIMTVTLNPCIDWQWETPEFVYGGLNRARAGAQYACGKGINVGIALRNLGLDPVCTGFMFRDDAGLYARTLDELGVRHDFVPVGGAVRVNIKLYDAASGAMTELNQAGGYVPDGAVATLFEKILDCFATLAMTDSSTQDILVLSGSMPASVPVDTYKKLCAAWPGRTIVDADGEALRLALTSETPPFLIKPNLYELTSSFGVELLTRESIAVFCQELIHKYGVSMICVSMGADGAMLVTGSDAYYVSAPIVTVRGVQGAGDAMVAGLVYGITRELPAPELLRVAAAAATASVERDGTLMCTREGFDKYLAELLQPCAI